MKKTDYLVLGLAAVAALGVGYWLYSKRKNAANPDPTKNPPYSGIGINA